MKFAGGKTCNSLVDFSPDLSKNLPTRIVSPSGRAEVTAHLASEEERVRSTAQKISLYALRDLLFADRTDIFHWDLSTFPEVNVASIKPSAVPGTQHENSHDQEADFESNIEQNHQTGVSVVGEYALRGGVVRTEGGREG